MAPADAFGKGDSLLHLERITQYVSLSPASLAHPLPALCASIFSPLLLSYFPPAHGIVLAYQDVSLSDSPPPSITRSQCQGIDGQDVDADTDDPLLLKHVDEYAAPFVWATASFLIWRPKVGAWIDGHVTHQSKTHITLAHLNTFPISILKEYLPEDWQWHSEEAGKLKKGWDGRIADEGGWWIDGEGRAVVGGVGGDDDAAGQDDNGAKRELRVRIRDFDGRMDGRGRGKGFLRIEGSLLSVAEEEARGGENVRNKDKRKGKGKRKVNGVEKSARAVNGEVMDIE